MGDLRRRPACGRLAERLDEDRATPTIVAMHHPPFDVGMLALDAIGLPLGQPL